MKNIFNVSENVIYNKKSTKKCQHFLSLIIVSDNENLNNQNALNDNMLLTDYNK